MDGFATEFNRWKHWTGTLKRKYRVRVVLLVLFVGLSFGVGRAITWLPFGPDGGDARSLTADPHDHTHLYLGTANGWVYESRNGGKEWQRLARVGKRDDLVLDNIIVDAVDSKHLLVGAWVLGSADGGLYVSHDGGLSWNSNADMRGESIRSLAMSAADPKVLVAGTLKGVYRSEDRGANWTLISPAGSRELHEVESIAIDPTDPKIIYAGTWHLPWKTSDGGAHWQNIKQGVIDDSDVFSIIVDPKQPKVVFASACSGIYKSEDAGEKFQKVQGIPSTARRTRVLMQDPGHLDTVYAGTTEGLFRSDDAGKTWVRTTGPELIVNDVYVDPTDSNRVLIATDRGGVMASRDRGNSFDPANRGFSARQITSFVTDAQRPSNVYVGVVNDKEWGGVFASDNGGLSWEQKSAGLGGRDVFSLGQASDGTIIAGTAHGIYRLTGGMWNRVGSKAGGESVRDGVSAVASEGKTGDRVAFVPAGAGVGAAAVKKKVVAGKHRAAGSAPKQVAAAQKRSAMAGDAQVLTDFDGSVYALAQAGDTVYAATSEGLLESGTAGESWKPVSSLKERDLVFVAAARGLLVAGGLHAVSESVDRGRTWSAMTLPGTLTQVTAVAADGVGGVWVGGREGVFVSVDKGATWDTVRNVSIRDVNALYYDAASERLMITTGETSTMAYAVHVPDRSVKFWDTGWKLRFVRPVGDHLVAATLFDGVVVQPQMIDSKLIAHQ